MKEYGIEISEHYSHTSAHDLLIEIESKTEADFIEEDEALMNSYELALKAIQDLKPMYRDIIEDRLLNNMKYEDIASKYGVPLQTVKNRIRRGKILIQESMAK